MSAFVIHEDQENRVPELRQKQTNGMAAPMKRSVLGIIDNNINVPKIIDIKEKQILKQTNAKNERKVAVSVHSANINADNRNLPAPIVPVAQFEAFKVYEDDEENEKNKNDFDDQKEDKENNPDLQDALENNDTSKNSLMSIEKSFDNSVHLAQEIILKNVNSKDRFFELEEYRDDIYAYLREHEQRHRPKPGYISKQPDVTDSMRAILVDWLVEVSEEYKLHTETLYLAVNFIDRFLSYMSVVRAKLQLVGTAAMFLAAKYEEIFPPDVNEFVYITDDTYSKHQVIRMEHLILKVLGFDLSVPTPLTFINAMCISAKLTEKTMYLSMYLSELAMLEVEPYLTFLPSVLAAASIALARHTLGEDPWSPLLTEVTGYKLAQLRDAIFFLYKMFVKAANHAQRAIPEKYKAGKYMRVSEIEPRHQLIKFE